MDYPPKKVAVVERGPLMEIRLYSNLCVKSTPHIFFERKYILIVVQSDVLFSLFAYKHFVD